MPEFLPKLWKRLVKILDIPAVAILLALDAFVSLVFWWLDPAYIFTNHFFKVNIVLLLLYYIYLSFVELYYAYIFAKPAYVCILYAMGMMLYATALGLLLFKFFSVFFE